MSRPLATVAVTPHGRLQGAVAGGVARFLGVPYAAPPIGPRRLRLPAPPASWHGTRDALAPAAASIQRLGGSQTWLYDPLPSISEDCLYLNVWTSDLAGRAPVLVWFHGGATRNGHGAAAAFDGTQFALRGLVVVTINYRLGALGGLAHPDLADPETGYRANWGMQDQIAALRWVRECASAFGGDPDNVTVAGQSSGATNALMLANNPDLAGMFGKVVAQSPPLFQSPMFAELADAAEYTELLASSVGLTVRSLATLDGAALFDAEAKLLGSKDLMARIGRPRTAPVRDGQLVREWTYCAAPSPKPLLIGWTRDEARFWYDLHDADGNRLAMMSAPQDEAGLVDQVGRLLRLYYPFDPAPRPTDVIAAYRRAADPTARRDPIDADWNEIYTDLVFRAPIVHQAARHARIGAPTYAYEFAHSLPAPGRGSPHASDVPFVFGTTGHPHLARKVGIDSSVRALSTLMLDAWAAFVRSGDPSTERLPWPAWTAAREATARFTTASSCSVTALDRCDELRVFQAFNP